MDSLGTDLIELILSNLPIPSTIVATSVCKYWNSIIRSRSFETRISECDHMPWLFLCSNVSNSYPTFAFDPASYKWYKLPNQIPPPNESFAASNGFLFTMSPEKFGFKQVFDTSWRQTVPQMLYTREPLITVYNELSCSNVSNFVVLGADLEGFLSMAIYNPRFVCWEMCPPPPHVIGNMNLSSVLCSTLFRGKIYVLVRSFFISSFDLKTHSWSTVRTLRPPGVMISFLISCRDQLVLAGLCNLNGEPEFSIWRIDERTLEFREIGVMPEELRSCFFGNVGERTFTGLKCLGSGNVVYVFSEERERNCPACVCEISISGECRWTRIPDLPESITCLSKITSFCSNVSLNDFLGKSTTCSDADEP